MHAIHIHILSNVFRFTICPVCHTYTIRTHFALFDLIERMCGLGCLNPNILGDSDAFCIDCLRTVTGASITKSFFFNTRGGSKRTFFFSKEDTPQQPHQSSTGAMRFHLSRRRPRHPKEERKKILSQIWTMPRTSSGPVRAP